MCCRLAEKYGTQPHVVAKWPFRYYKILRDQYLIGLLREVVSYKKARNPQTEVSDPDDPMFGMRKDIDVDVLHDIKG